MRLVVLVLIVITIATGAWFLTSQSAVQPGGAADLYQGTGETNLDLNSDDNILLLDIPAGQVVIGLRPDLAPVHIQRIKELVRKGFYDGLKFHRVIEGFMAQGGDPQGNGQGGSGINLPAEFSQEMFERGVMGMARARSINSADSQFFIMLGDAPHLNGQYTVWGRVLEGMEFVDALKKGSKHANGKISGKPDRIKQMQIKSDVVN